MHHMTHLIRQKRMHLTTRLSMLVVLLAGCQPSADRAQVEDYLRGLPDWDTFSPPLPDQSPTPIGDPVEFIEVVDVVEFSDEDADNDGAVDTTILEDVEYNCVSTPHTMTATPENIVMYSPDVELLWPGALIQGQSHRDGLGSLLALPIAERAPLQVSIPSIPSGDNFRLVEEPNQANVYAAIGSIVGDATAADLSIASTISFEQEIYNQESEFALSIDASGRYLGFEANASGSVQGSSAKTTMTAHFSQKMYEVVVGTPATPDAFFSDAFTLERLQEQEELGRVGEDNLPVYISNVVFGRMLTFSFTSSASESKIRAALEASYSNLLADGSLGVSAEHQAILEEAEISVTSLGGDAESTLALIRSGNLADYFDSDVPLSSAAALSYTFRNVGDNSIAVVSETTEFNITECQAMPPRPSKPGQQIMSGDGLCLEVGGILYANGSRVQVGTCSDDPGAKQRWTLDGAGRLVNDGGLCLDVDNIGRENGDVVQIWECHTDVQQRWDFTESEQLYSYAGKCLDVHGPKREVAGTPTQVWECHATDDVLTNQIWRWR